MNCQLRKENIIISQNESMLVSERKGLQKSFKVIQKCQCQNSIKSIETKLELIELKLEQLTSNVNISFTKYMECYGKLIDEQKKRENLQYAVKEAKQLNKAVQDKISTEMAKQKQSLENLNQEVHSWSRLLRDVKAWKSTYNTWSANLQKNIFDTFKGYKQENDENVKNIYSAVEEIGLLQRKMLEKWDNPPPNERRSRAVSYNERQFFPAKKSIGQDQTTIYAGKHYYK